MTKKSEREKFEEQAARLRAKTGERRLDRIKHDSVVKLDPQVRRFCMFVAEGKAASDAAHLAGFEDPGKHAKLLMSRPTVRRALSVMIERTMKVSEVTRDDVIAGFQDAIAIARQQSEAMGMIAGYREIGKMLGMYETKVKVEITGGAGEIQRQLQGMSDAELLRMISERSNLLPPIEGELAEDAEIIPDGAE